MEPVAVWDQILASARQQASTTPSRKSSLAKLQLTAEPPEARSEKRVLPSVNRDPAAIDPILDAAIRKVVAGEAPWPLFVHGPAGVGKTCASLCLVDYVYGSMYHTAASLCTDLIEAQQGRLVHRNREGQSFDVHLTDLWRWIARTPLFVLDELGSRDKVTDHHYDAVKRVLDDRHGKPLVVTSNHPLGSIAALYDDRVASRLAAGTVVRLQGKDRRLP